MFRTVEMPLWLLTLIVLFAAVTFASHFLFPSVRWFFRRRMERVVARLNQRLERPIQPFKLARRHDMIQRLIYDPKVVQAVADHARHEGVPENVAFEEAKRYAREIVPSFSATAYFSVAIRLARWLARALYTVHLDESNDAALRAIDGDATVIFVMNHRSNMDYVLVTYLVADRSALSYAVGEWARVWPLSALIRAMGAFFIRRTSRNTLYRRVLARYVQLATRGGVTQAIFPEGGLSLDGSMGPAKLGLLSYIVADFEPGTGADVVFVPVALNYDRVLEDRVLTDAAKSGTRRFRASVLGWAWFTIRYAWRRMTGRAVRFGHAGVGFGAPLSLNEFVAAHKGEAITGAGEELRRRVMAVIPVLPVPMVAWLLLRHGGTATRAALAKEAVPYLQRISHPAMNDPAKVVDDGLASLLARRIVREGPDGVHAEPDSAELLTYYANSVTHLF
ncbi:MAG: 1-acyl-sn-glycerol-3-phosphate acyltransferase [Rhodobacter sp.]|nr:1-acyl-sn-glycerol-3-phosphate acyltransferase [Rhodobacter sp.]